MLIGITGNIGTGKSRVTNQLAHLLDAQVLSADQICRELLEPGQQGCTQFLHLVGNKYSDGQGKIDRLALRSDLFKDKQLKDKLESILHPLVRERILDEKTKLSSGSIVIAEVPLLFESDWKDDFDLVVSVSAPAEVSITRVIQRDGGTDHDVQSILAAQISQEKKDKLADTVIDNSAGWEATEKRIAKLASWVRKEAGKVRA